MKSHRIKIVTDSACDLPDHILEKHQITMVPLSIHFGDDVYQDRVELPTLDFYRKLRNSEQLPTTSQVNPNQFLEVFERLLTDEESQIICIGISLALSGTLQSALLAKETLGNDRIHIFDTKNCSLGEGLQVIRAAELAAAGNGLEEILSALNQQRRQAFSMILLDSLSHLVKGGRLSKAQGVVGSVLNIKPILRISPEGLVEPAEKVRSQRRALQLMIKRAKEQRGDFSATTVGVAHSDAPELAEEFTEVVKAELQPAKVITSLVGATIGTHAGPGGIGLFF